MKSLDEIVGGLQLIASFSPIGDIETSAEHDVLYAGPAREHDLDHDWATVEVKAALELLGWHWDEDVDSFAHFT